MFASFDRSRGRGAMMSALVDGGVEKFPPRSKKSSVARLTARLL